MPGPGRFLRGGLSAWAAVLAVLAGIAAAALLAVGDGTVTLRIGIFLGLLCALLVWFAGRGRALLAENARHEELRADLAALAVQVQQVERTIGRVVAEQGDSLHEDLSRLGWSQQSGLRRQEQLLRELGRLLPGGAPLPREETPSDGVEIPPEIAALPTSEAEGTLPTSEAEGALPTSEAEGALPTSEAEGTLPTSEAEAALSTSEAEGTLPTSEAEAALSTSEAEGTPPTALAHGRPAREDDGPAEPAGSVHRHEDPATPYAPPPSYVAEKPDAPTYPPIGEQDERPAPATAEPVSAAGVTWSEHSWIDLTEGSTPSANGRPHQVDVTDVTDVDGETSLDPADYGWRSDWLPNLDHLPPIDTRPGRHAAD